MTLSSYGLGRFLGEENGNPLQCSCLENTMDRGTWWGSKESDMTEHISTYDFILNTGAQNSHNFYKAE